MIIYYATGVILLIFALGIILQPDKNLAAVIIFITSIYLFLFSGLRGPDVDRDYKTYINMFERVPNLSEFNLTAIANLHGDLLFFIISSLLHSLNLDSTFLFLSFSLLSLTIYLYCFNKFSPYPALSFFIYFCHNFLNKEMTQIRTGLASAFILLVICNYSKIKRFWYYFYSTLASLSHSSALVVFIASYFAKISNTRNKFLLCMLLALLGSNIWVTIFNFLPHELSLVAQVENYLAWDEYNYSLGFFNPVLLKQLFIIFFAFYYKDRIGDFGAVFESSFVFYRFSTIWLIVFSDFAILGARIANLFSVSELLLVPLLLKGLILNGARVGFSVLLIFSVLTSFSLLYYNLEIKGFLAPYKTIFF